MINNVLSRSDARIRKYRCHIPLHAIAEISLYVIKVVPFLFVMSSTSRGKA